MLTALLAALLSALWALPAQAKAQSPGWAIGSAPSWIQPLEVNLNSTPPQAQVAFGVHYLLAEHQLRVDEQERVSYRHIAVRALNEQGVESVANIEIRFDPSFEVLTLHAINVRRGAQLIRKLQASAVHLLQREKELDALIFDGSKTAHVFLDDVRIGDVVEYAYSVRGNNPVFGNRHFGRFDFQWNAPVARVYARLLWPQGRALHLRRFNDAPAPEISELGGHREHRWDLRDVSPRPVEKDAPSWFDPYPSVQWSEFADWQSVVQWAEPLYRVPEPLGPQVRAEIRRIALAQPDAGQRMLSALRFVQREVRYLGVEIGAGSHAPSSPERVLQRRFGDCKDKSLLTIAMLRALGVEAHAALVNTNLRHGIEGWQPAPGAFNHVLVRARIGRDVYWIDPTLALQRGSLARLVQSDHGLALVIDPRTEGLQPMVGDMARMRWREVLAVFDASGGIEQPVSYTVKTVVEGPAADSLRQQLAAQSREALQKSYLNYYANYYAGIEVTRPFEVADDAEENQLTLNEYYSIRNFWHKSEANARREATIAVPEVYELLRRPQQLVRESPLALTHPIDLVHVTEVRLPEGWQLKPAQIKVEDPVFEFQRTESWSDGVLTLNDRYRSRRREVEAGDIERYAQKLAQAREAVDYSLYRGGVPASSRSADTREPPPSAAADAAPAAGSGDGPHWIPAVLATLSVLSFFVLARRAYRWDPVPPARPTSFGLLPMSEGLGGWLILVGFGLLASLAQQARVLLEVWPSMRASLWLVVATPGQPDYHPLWALILSFELVACIALLAAYGVTILLFFKRRSSLPRVYIVVTALAAGCAVIDAVLSLSIPAAAKQLGSKEWALMGRGLIFSGIWIAYFMHSQRVRLTFVERLKRESPPAAEPGGPGGARDPDAAITIATPGPAS